mmetsp:Transcript_23294/g.51163  ORF Transcript_23294/g.51163 Transcript_23294/m.51163 type:complete len:503 (-) Transcript_23294:139-1647(-)
MLVNWLLGPGSQTGCCARSPKGYVGCFRDTDEGAILEYAPHTRTCSREIVIDRVGGRVPLLPAGPKERTVPTYSTVQDATGSPGLQGRPLFTGDVLRLSLGDAIHESVMALYANGFLLKPRFQDTTGLAQPAICRLWSPFSLIEKCQVKSKQNDSQWAIFKLTFFRREGQDASFYFATAGPSAEAERDRWVAEIVKAMGNLTLSLFPRFGLSVDPLPERDSTSTRIMAGYLMEGGLCDSAMLVFCELHAYASRESKLVLYKDEFCEHAVQSIPLCDSSIVSTRKGEYCTVFGINDHLFCARTEEERELWLRAVSNIKVKLMFDAPDPTPEDLEVFRSSVYERIETMAPPLPPGGREAWDAYVLAATGGSFTGLDLSAAEFPPVLAEAPRKPLSSPLGDMEDIKDDIFQGRYEGFSTAPPEEERPPPGRSICFTPAQRVNRMANLGGGVSNSPGPCSEGEADRPYVHDGEPIAKRPVMNVLMAAAAASVMSLDTPGYGDIEGL